MTPTSAAAALSSPWSDFAEGFQLISVFDTTVCDNNLGNAIIMEAVSGHLEGLFPKAFFMKLPYLDSLGDEAVRYARQSRYVFFGGTNALSSDMQAYRQWGIDAALAQAMGPKVVLMGVGWWQYQADPTDYTREVLKGILHPTLQHSVRDSYTRDKLRAIGFENVVVTACPSLWAITDAHCAAIPTEKAENVLLTLTHYNRHPSDAALVDTLRRNYRRVFLWVQGPEDYQYARTLGGGFEVVSPSLAALDRLLRADLSLDFVGTRLHAGIRAVAAGRRTVIIGIDNRAIEMGRDVILPVLPRPHIDRLDAVVNSRFSMRVQPPHAAVAAWKAQFTH